MPAVAEKKERSSFASAIASCAPAMPAPSRHWPTATTCTSPAALARATTSARSEYESRCACASTSIRLHLGEQLRAELPQLLRALLGELAQQIEALRAAQLRQSFGRVHPQILGCGSIGSDPDQALFGPRRLEPADGPDRRALRGVAVRSGQRIERRDRFLHSEPAGPFSGDRPIVGLGLEPRDQMTGAARIPESRQRRRRQGPVELPQRIVLEHLGDLGHRRWVAERHQGGERFLPAVIVRERGLQLPEGGGILHVGERASGGEPHRFFAGFQDCPDPRPRRLAGEPQRRPDRRGADLGNGIGQQREHRALASEEVLRLAQQPHAGERRGADQRLRVLEQIAKPGSEDPSRVDVARTPALEERAGGVHAQRSIGRIERLARVELCIGRPFGLRLRLPLPEQRGEEAHHFTLDPGFTSPGNSMAVCSRSPPLAYRTMPCETRPFPKSRGGRFATTQTTLPTSSCGSYDCATPLTMVRGAASPRSIDSFSNLSFLGTRSAESTFPARRSIWSNCSRVSSGVTTPFAGGEGGTTAEGGTTKREESFWISAYSTFRTSGAGSRTALFSSGANSPHRSSAPVCSSTPFANRGTMGPSQRAQSRATFTASVSSASAPSRSLFSFSHGFCACSRWFAADENSSTFWTTARVSHRSYRAAISRSIARAFSSPSADRVSLPPFFQISESALLARFPTFARSSPLTRFFSSWSERSMSLVVGPRFAA